MFVLTFCSSKTTLLLCSPVAQVLDVNEVNDFAFSLYDRGTASRINKSYRHLCTVIQILILYVSWLIYRENTKKQWKPFHSETEALQL